MFSRTAKSVNKNGNKRALSIILSSVLAITLLQVAPPARASLPAAPAPLVCTPIASVVFDGTSLRRIYDFTQVGTCTWTAPSEAGQASVLLVAGGDGGAEGVGGRGGEVKESSPSMSPGDELSITVGGGGIGETSLPAQPGEASSITIGLTQLIAQPSIATNKISSLMLGRPHDFGGTTQATGQTGPANSGSGGGAKTGDQIMSGNGASGRVVVSYAIDNSSFWRYKADGFVAASDAQSAYWGEVSDPSDLSRRACVD